MPFRILPFIIAQLLLICVVALRVAQADVVEEEPQSLPETVLFSLIVLALLLFFGLWWVKYKKKQKKED